MSNMNTSRLVYVLFTKIRNARTPITVVSDSGWVFRRLTVTSARIWHTRRGAEVNFVDESTAGWSPFSQTSLGFIWDASLFSNEANEEYRLGQRVKISPAGRIVSRDVDRKTRRNDRTFSTFLRCASLAQRTIFFLNKIIIACPAP